MKKIEDVKQPSDLAELIRGLAGAAGRGELENATLESFLEAMAAWIDDMDGYFANIGQSSPTQPDWRLIATMLRAASVYE